MPTLRNLLILICLIFIISHCNPRKEVETKTIISDSIFIKNDPTVPMDTIVTEKELTIYNEPYKLKIIEYRLKDTATVSELKFQKPAYIILTKNNKEIFTKRISRETFKDGLDSTFYNTSTLWRIEYDFVRTNRLYFKAVLAIPETCFLQRINFAIFYKTNKIGQLDFWAEDNSDEKDDNNVKDN